jgi:predicted RNA-binding Zn ribbon-like protein
VGGWRRPQAESDATVGPTSWQLPHANQDQDRRRKTLHELWFPTEKPEDLYAPLAYSAAKLFTEVDQTRIRKCGACILHFLDISKKGTRYWCSMQLCGNRSKVVAYAARQRLTR